MALNVPQLNFGVAPIAQLPTGMGDMGNALIQAQQMRTQRQAQQEALARQMEQQKFQNNMALQNQALQQDQFSLQKQQAGEQSKSRQIQDKAAQFNLDQGKQKAERQTAKQEILKSYLPQLKELQNDPASYFGYYGEIMSNHPEAFDLEDTQEVIQRLHAIQKDEKSMDLAEKQYSNTIKYQNAMLGMKKAELDIAKARAMQTGESIPKERMDYYKTMFDKTTTMRGQIAEKVSNSKSIVVSAKKLIARALTDSNIALITSPDSIKTLGKVSKDAPDLIQQIMGRKEKKDIQSIAAEIENLLIKPAETDLINQEKELKLWDDKLGTIYKDMESLNLYREQAQTSDNQPATNPFVESLSQLGNRVVDTVNNYGKAVNRANTLRNVQEKMTRSTPATTAINNAMGINANQPVDPGAPRTKALLASTDAMPFVGDEFPVYQDRYGRTRGEITYGSPGPYGISIDRRDKLKKVTNLSKSTLGG